MAMTTDAESSAACSAGRSSAMADGGASATTSTEGSAAMAASNRHADGVGRGTRDMGHVSAGEGGTCSSVRRVLPSRKGVPAVSDADDWNEETPQERHLNIHFSPEIMAGVYANFANVSHSAYEFTMTFARGDHEVEEDEVPGVVVSRVNLSPRFMKELLDAMADNYSKWSTKEGIKNLPEFNGEEDDQLDE